MTMTLSRKRRSCFCVVFAVLLGGLTHLSFASTISSTAPATHPVALAPDTDASTCLGCHSNIQEGKYVHSAMQMGCLSCHVIQQQGGTTVVALNAPADQLCFSCHTKSTDSVQHMPYRTGGCTVCHSPHASNFPAHTLVAHQDLCLGCHAQGLPKVSKNTITTPWGARFTSAQFKRVFYLGLNKAHTANHPVEGHPVTGPNSLVAKAPGLSCLSCHTAHTSTEAHLRPPQFKTPLSLCLSCHTSM
jgi:predicted CXXCH cytochrome family protein